jgi:hypothetical protein
MRCLGEMMKAAEVGSRRSEVESRKSEVGSSGPTMSGAVVEEVCFATNADPLHIRPEGDSIDINL